MRAGNLDRVVLIQNFTVQDDGAGNQIETWATEATVRAELLQASTQEFQRAWGSSSEPTYVFRIRWVDGLNLAKRIVHDGIIREIVELKEIGRRKGWEIRTAGYGQPLEP